MRSFATARTIIMSSRLTLFFLRFLLYLLGAKFIFIQHTYTFFLTVREWKSPIASPLMRVHVARMMKMKSWDIKKRVAQPTRKWRLTRIVRDDIKIPTTVCERRLIDIKESRNVDRDENNKQTSPNSEVLFMFVSRVSWNVKIISAYKLSHFTTFLFR